MDLDESAGVPLGHFLEHKAGVRFHCRTCAAHHDLPVAMVIQDLEGRGVGGPFTGIKAVARFVRKPCARCGSLSFETMPAWGYEG